MAPNSAAARRPGHLVDTAIAYPGLTVGENLDVERRCRRLPTRPPSPARSNNWASVRM
jgi:hypothetical protein